MRRVTARGWPRDVANSARNGHVTENVTTGRGGDGGGTAMHPAKQKVLSEGGTAMGRARPLAGGRHKMFLMRFHMKDR